MILRCMNENHISVEFPASELRERIPAGDEQIICTGVASF
jgi:hypothetical protein